MPLSPLRHVCKRRTLHHCEQVLLSFVGGTHVYAQLGSSVLARKNGGSHRLSALVAGALVLLVFAFSVPVAGRRARPLCTPEHVKTLCSRLLLRIGTFPSSTLQRFSSSSVGASFTPSQSPPPQGRNCRSFWKGRAVDGVSSSLLLSTGIGSRYRTRSSLFSWRSVTRHPLFCIAAVSLRSLCDWHRLCLPRLPVCPRSRAACVAPQHIRRQNRDRDELHPGARSLSSHQQEV